MKRWKETNPLIAKIMLSEADKTDDNIRQVKAKLLTKRKNLEMFLRLLKLNYLDQDKDVMVLITGDKGDGKSSLILRMGLIWSLITGERFSMVRNLTYTNNPQEIKKKLLKIKQKGGYQFLGHDEAARILLGEDWNKKENKELKKVFGEIRTAHALQVFACPFKVTRVDSKYLESFFQFWIHVFDRDKAIIFRKNKNPVGEAYSIDKLKKMIKYIPPHMNKRQWNNLVAKLSRLPDYYGVVKWGKIPKDIYARYLKQREKAVWAFEEKQKEQKKEAPPLETVSKRVAKYKDAFLNILVEWVNNGKSIGGFIRKYKAPFKEQTARQWLKEVGIIVKKRPKDFKSEKDVLGGRPNATHK